MGANKVREREKGTSRAHAALFPRGEKSPHLENREKNRGKELTMKREAA